MKWVRNFEGIPNNVGKTQETSEDLEVVAHTALAITRIKIPGREQCGILQDKTIIVIYT